MKCRFCNNELDNIFVDLINSPPSNSYLTQEQLNEPEEYFPLKIFVCENCWLVQVDEYKKSHEIFNKDYAYFSSMSKSWLLHSENYVNMISKKLGLNELSQVVEIASNDGYLLQYFQQKSIPCMGVEPTGGTAKVSREKGIKTIEDFFSVSLAEKLAKSDLILGNNVLAHVPNINDFVKGLKIALKHDGTITMEFPHLLNLIKYNQFDTIYHEHFSYLSLHVVSQIFEEKGLKIYDVEELSTHGGSLRIYATHIENGSLDVAESVSHLLQKEKDFGLLQLETYNSFQNKAYKVKYEFSKFLLEQNGLGKQIIAYGAAAKGNTLLNFCGIKNDLIDFVIDVAPSKQGKFLPGSHIPVVSEKILIKHKPEFVILFPWNIKQELIEQLSYIREWGAKFVVAIPELEIF